MIKHNKTAKQNDKNVEKVFFLPLLHCAHLTNAGIEEIYGYCPRPLEGRGHVTLAHGDSNTLRVRRAPLNSGFSRKSREKRLEVRAGLYCNGRPIGTGRG